MPPTLRTSTAAAPGLQCRKCQVAIAPGTNAVFVEGVAQTVLAEDEPNVFCTLAHVRDYAEQKAADWKRAAHAPGASGAESRVAGQNREAYQVLVELVEKAHAHLAPPAPARWAGDARSIAIDTPIVCTPPASPRTR